MNDGSETGEKAASGSEVIDQVDLQREDHTLTQTATATAAVDLQQSVYAVLSMDNFMLLRTENDYGISVLQQLETATSSLFKQQVITV